MSKKVRVTRLAAGESFVGDVSDDELKVTLDSGRYTPNYGRQGCRPFDVAVNILRTLLREGAPDRSYIEEWSC